MTEELKEFDDIVRKLGYKKVVHSKWIVRGYSRPQCEHCGRYLRKQEPQDNYCPKCGAIMDGGSNV